MRPEVSACGWKSGRLGDPDIGSIVMGQSPESASYNKSGIGLPFFQGKADFGLRNPTPRTWCSSPARIAEPGDVLVSVRAPVGDSNIVVEKCCIGRGIAAIRPGPDTDGEFLFYSVLYHRTDLDALGLGAIFKAINKDTLRTFEVALPPLREQRAIAAVLSKIQAAVAVEDKIVATLKELKAATMAKIFREGLRSESLKQTEIGEIPESWRVAELGKIAQIGNGSTPKRDNQSYWEKGNIPWLTSAKVHESIIESADEFVTDVARSECHLPLVRKNSVVIAITGQGKTLGNAALVTFDTCVSQHLAYIQFQTSEVVPEFMLFFLQGRYEHFRQVSQAGGSTKGALTCGFLKAYQVPIPSIEEQRQMAGIMGSLTIKLKTARAYRQALNNLFFSMLNLLMTGEVRVDSSTLWRTTRETGVGHIE